MTSQLRPATWTVSSVSELQMEQEAAQLTPAHAHMLSIDYRPLPSTARQPLGEPSAGKVDADVGIVGIGVGRVVDDLGDMSNAAAHRLLYSQ